MGKWIKKIAPAALACLALHWAPAALAGAQADLRLGGQGQDGRRGQERCQDWRPPETTVAPCPPGTFGEQRWKRHWRCGQGQAPGSWGPAAHEGGCFAAPPPQASVCHAATVGYMSVLRVDCGESGRVFPGAVLDGGGFGDNAKLSGYYMLNGSLVRSDSALSGPSGPMGMKLCGGIPPIAAVNAYCMQMPSAVNGDFYKWVVGN